MHLLKILPTILLATALHAAPKPNIIIILADDMGIDSVSANNPAMGPLKTPHIDRLISQGMNFTDAHSGSAVCTPTRYGLLTGRYAWRTRLKNQVLWEYGRPLIQKDRPTLPGILQKNGYHTAIIGKWHLGLNWHDKGGNLANDINKDSDSFFKRKEAAERIKTVAAKIDFSQPITGGPTELGFDYWFGHDAPNFPPYAWIINDKLQNLPTAEKPKSMFGHPGPMVPGWQLEPILPTLKEKSVQYIKQQATTENPFFLYIPLTSPHTPISPSETWQGKSNIDRYCDFIMQTDHVVGEILKALDESNQADNTIVIFTADNGTAPAGAKFNKLAQQGVDLKKNFKGHKAQIHEGGHRVPFTIKWPNHIPANSTCAEVISLNDLMATFADILEIELPENAAPDSYPITPLLDGKSKTLPNRPHIINHSYSGQFAIRDGKWKYIPGKAPKLYDLHADPKETKNLSDDNPEIVTRLQTSLEKIKSQP